MNLCWVYYFFSSVYTSPYFFHKHNVTFQFRASDSQIYMNFKPSIDNGPLVGTDFVIEKAYRVGRPRSDSKPRRIVDRFLNYKDREAVSKPRG